MKRILLTLLLCLAVSTADAAQPRKRVTQTPSQSRAKVQIQQAQPQGMLKLRFVDREGNQFDVDCLPEFRAKIEAALLLQDCKPAPAQFAVQATGGEPLAVPQAAVKLWGTDGRISYAAMRPSGSSAGDTLLAAGTAGSATTLVEAGPGTFACGSTIPDTDPPYKGQGPSTVFSVSGQTLSALATFIARCDNCTITGSDGSVGRAGGKTMPSGSTLVATDNSTLTGAAQKSANLSDLASAATARTNLQAAPYGSAVVYHKIGAPTPYEAASDTNAARGTALITAVNAAANGEWVVAGPGTYDISTTFLELGGSGRVIHLSGAGEGVTIISSSVDLASAAAIHPGDGGASGQGSVVENLTIACALTDGTFQAAWGGATAQDRFRGVTLRNVTLTGDTDGVYVPMSTQCSGTIQNIKIVTKWDCIVINGPSQFTIENFDLTSTGDSSSPNFTGEGAVRGILLTGAGGDTSQATTIRNGKITVANTLDVETLGIAGQSPGTYNVKNVAITTTAGDGSIFDIQRAGGTMTVHTDVSGSGTSGALKTFGTITYTNATGTGKVVRETSPTFVTPILGTPTSGTLTNCTIPVGGISGLGTGVGTALAVNVGSAGSPVVNGGALGTPSSGNGSNITNVNAATLGGATFAAPGTIGGGTPGAGNFTTGSFTGAITLGNSGLTIASGEITVTKSFHTLSGEGATDDSLVTINGGSVGGLLVLHGNDDHVITISQGGGNIHTPNGADVVLATATASAMCVKTATNEWSVVALPSTPGEDSIEFGTGGLQLVNDASAPGNSKYYGTNGSGTKGFYDLPEGGGGFSGDIELELFPYADDVALGDGGPYGNLSFIVGPDFNGRNITAVRFIVVTAGTTGTTDFQIIRRRAGSNVDVLSTVATIDSTETDTSTAATPAVINTSNDDLATGDVLIFCIDAKSTTAPKGGKAFLETTAP